MNKLTPNQKEMIERYQDYDLDDLYNEIGNALARTTDSELNRKYVLGTPNVRERGAKVVRDVGAALCDQRARLEKLLSDNKEILEPIDWVATIGDAIISLKIGIPPWSTACALGKLCNYTLAKLCGGAAGTEQAKA